jgi:hypothetical protein
MAQQQKQPAPMQSLFDLMKTHAVNNEGKYISQEFQDYGYRLACDLDDEAHKALYIKMAKTIDRGILDQARTFVLDAHAQSKARLFMWKVKQLKDAKAAKRRNT